MYPTAYNPPEALAGVAPLGWWERQSGMKKAAIVGGGIAGISLAIWGVRRLTRVEPIKDISEGCNDFGWANQAEIEEAVLPLLRSARTRTGTIDPFYVTTRFLKKYAPDCRSYPEEARNVGEAQMYVEAFVNVVNTMEGERMLSPDQKGYFLQMVSVWGRNQGLTDEQLPAQQAGFESGSNGNGSNGNGGSRRVSFSPA